MRWSWILRTSCAALLVCSGISTPAGFALHRRQGTTDTGLPTLTSQEGPASTTPPPNSTPNDQATEQSTGSPPASTTEPGQSVSSSSLLSSDIESSSFNLTSSSTRRPLSTRSSHAPTSAPTNGTAVDDQHHAESLPIKPRITPAFSVGGVILILTGVVFCLVGVKNKWIQISFSSAYLASLAVTVLINYVMSPPISNGIQGAYLVAIFLTGLIFGAGSLIFKEVTEGLGCLLGGFCLSMWFLTLKSGGLITNQTGKGIFIAIFCAIAWSLSFSHYTRVYGSIGSTAFGGATAFVLGIDCFSKVGLKEFWFYIWGLNDNLFPLGTTTYPMTRGIRVEIVIIILATVIGIISQIKLWKIVRDKQKRREDELQDAQRRNEIVEQALGRQLERQNDKDRSNWEKQYGNKLQSKRETILWTDAHPDKSYTHITSLEKRSSSSESLEMAAFGGKRQSRLQRQSSALTVDVIPEENEDQHEQTRLSLERQKALTALQEDASSKGEDAISVVPAPTNAPPEVVPLPFRIPAAPNSPVSTASIKTGDPSMLQEPKRASRRRSLQSMLSLSPRLSTEQLTPSESQEALVLPDPLQSRPSSIAATLDVENDVAEVRTIASKSSAPPTPKIVVLPASSFDHFPKTLADAIDQHPGVGQEPPSPPALSVSFDFDPEELSRPVEPSETATKMSNPLKGETKEKSLSKDNKSSSTSDSGVKQSSESHAQSNISTGQTSEVLTKGVLDQVPSQLSNVVLSYRTNEWAKHISTADAPVFDEPEAIEGADEEPPTQLAPLSPDVPASPTEQTMDSSRTLSTSSKPPPPHVTTSASSGNVVANVPPPQRSISDQAVSKPSAPAKSGSGQPSRSSSSKAKRSSWGNSGMKPTLASTPIDENAPSEFVSSQVSLPYQSIGTPQRMGSSASIADPSKAQSPITQDSRQPLPRANSYSTIDDSILRMSRSASTLSNHPALRSESRLSNMNTPKDPRCSSSVLSNYNPALTRSETRLSNHDSHQPIPHANTTSSRKREQLLADWRISQQQGTVTNVMPKMSVDTRRAQMLLDKEHKRLMEDQQKAASQQKQFALDQVMRRPEMQDAHREAIRKMQAGVGKKP